ncbi:MAG: PAS domain-containing protein [Myxococcales bacterium]
MVLRKPIRPDAYPVELLQLVMDNIPQFIFWKDRQSVFLGCNRNFARAAGVGEPENIVGKTDFDLAWKREEAEFFRAVDQRVMESGKPEYHIIEPLRQADGKQIWLETNKVPLLDESGEVVGILGTFEDITSRKQAELTLADHEFKLRTILDSIAEGVIATDAEGRVARMNPVAAALTGFSLETAVGLPLNRVYRAWRSDGSEQYRDLSELLASRNARNSRDLLLRRHEDEASNIVETASPILDREGTFHGVVLVIRDVTLEKQVEDRLRHAQKMDSIGQLAGGIAHDFNNMLGGIIGAAELLQRDLAKQPTQRNFASLILRTSERATELTSKLLAFSRRGKLQLREVDIHEAIDDVVAIARRSIDRSVEIVIERLAEHSLLRGDPSELQTALLNLALNARDAMPRGGVLTIRTENRLLDQAYCSTSAFEIQPGEYVQISVSDTGVGIDPGQQEHIFEPFYTTKPIGEGTGLGLSAVYGTVLEHQGSIQVYSEPGEGTVFHLLFPAHGKGAERARLPADDAPRGTGTVLVVDDEEVIRMTAGLMLEELGYQVLTARDGLEALEIYRKEGERIAAVLLDVVMPRMGGRACFEAIRAFNPRVRVVMCSGFTKESVMVELNEKGVKSFLKKPYRRGELAAAIRDALA